MTDRSHPAVQPDLLPAEEDRLILAAQKDPAAFQTLYDHWVVPVYQYFYHRTGEMTSAEDLTSQLFLTVYQALTRYQPRGRFAAWLFTIARNLAIEFYRQQAREVPLETARNLPSTSDPAAEAMQAGELQALIQLVHSLPEPEQELIRLRYVVGLSFADMATVLEKREDAVKKSLYRLQDRLQVALKNGHRQEDYHD